MTRVVIGGVVVFLALLGLSFFTVFMFHPESTVHEQVKDVLDSGEGVFPFSEDANTHMWDVFYLMRFFRILTAICIIASLYMLSKWNVRSISVAACGLCLGIPLIALILPWDAAFELFHRLFFPQGNYAFPVTSLLIQTYPEEFFIRFASLWAALLGFLGLSLLGRKQLALLLRRAASKRV